MKTSVFTSMIATIAILFASMTSRGQGADTMTILPPVIGIEEAFIVKSHIVNHAKVIRITYISTVSGTTGFSVIAFDTLQPDSMGRYPIDTFRKGLPKITKEKTLWVKQELILASDGVTLMATSLAEKVTVLPIPLLPTIAFAGTPVNNKKVFANLAISANVTTRLDAYAVFKTKDTLQPAIPRNKAKPWYLSPSTTSYVDSSYATMDSVLIRYGVVDTIKPSLYAFTRWVWVSGYITPAIAEVGIYKGTDSTTSILKLSGWCITKNLVTKLKIILESGDTLYLTIPASNGLSYWSVTAVNRVPGKTYNIVVKAINAKGTGTSNPFVYQMGTNPQATAITSLTYYSNGYDLIANFGYTIADGKTGDAVLEYTNATDVNFDTPELGWTTFKGLSKQGSEGCTFVNVVPGKYLLRCQLNDGKNVLIKIVPFTLHAASVKEFTLNQIAVYPNPAKDVIHSDQQITLYNSLGAEVGFGTEIFIENLPSGFYFYKALGSNTYSGKILKE